MQIAADQSTSEDRTSRETNLPQEQRVSCPRRRGAPPGHSGGIAPRAEPAHAARCKAHRAAAEEAAGLALRLRVTQCHSTST